MFTLELTVESSVFATVVDLKHATIKIKDGGSEEVTVKIGEGNLTFTERKNIDYMMDRGVLDTVREGDEVPMDVSFTVRWDYVQATGSPATVGNTVTVESALKGTASGWVSTDADPCTPYAVDIEVTLDPNCNSLDAMVYTFTDFRYEEFQNDIKAATISVSGKCNAKSAVKTYA